MKALLKRSFVHNKVRYRVNPDGTEFPDDFPEKSLPSDAEVLTEDKPAKKAAPVKDEKEKLDL